ncbi:MAG: hypothetical protein NZ952_00415 [Candidatus Bathyarchaeota archaeon]|nr:hypothetical protein [Candidatus Bathyarchaeota archaeon]
MMRRILDLSIILLFVWACMLFGLWLISSVIVPFEMPFPTDTFLTAALKVIFAGLLVILWLWIWREIVRRMFWRTIKSVIEKGS